MNPDDITITVTAAIGGACLLSLLVALLILTYVDQLRRCLCIRTRPTPRPTSFPARYVLPYRRATYHQNSSDEFPQRNTTPGPSNVPRTPPPAYPAKEAEDYGRYLRAHFCIPSPTNSLPVHALNPQRVHFENVQTQIWALVLEQALRHPGNASPIRVGSPTLEPPAPLILHTASTVRVCTPDNLAPYPREDSDSDSDYGGNEPIPEREDDDPLNAYGGDYEWPELGAIDQVILGPYRSQAWELRESQWDTTSPSPTNCPFHNAGETQPSRQGYLPTETELSTLPPPEIQWRVPALEQRPNSMSWLTTYSHWPSQRETTQTWMEPPDFDNFYQDEETFSGYTAEVYEDYRGYTPAPQQPSFYTAPFSLPDSPNWENRHHP
ncbi:uncharacterized protein ARMOST_19805 [Armillaria ostoyae]|uniref:Uncharacterized protein n=1 Tax=Armillaria ostoyae TaxID=47428 RepID=A0A284S5J3_ARMOS|nr:uncharacterized protein ARMOST_19805 [Armillaria ostoyae]